MESIGEKLKTARETKGYTLEQVARDTHIAKRFLTALENEDFSLFPGEPYLLGFLRNYAEYLGLSAQEIISLYKNLKLQEQPAPMNELLERRRAPVGLITGAVIVVLAAAGLGLFLFLGGKGNKETKHAAPATVHSSQRSAGQGAVSGQDYTFQGGMRESTFKRGDAINVQLKGKEYRLLLTGIGKSVTISTPTGVVDVVPDQEKLIDLSGDGKADIKLLVRSISTQSSTPSAVIRLDTVVQGVAASSSNEPAASTPSATDSASSTTAESSLGNASVIATLDQQQPFTVDMTFTAPALFRYAVDSGQSQQRYYDAGQTFSTTATSKFELWLSNAGAANMTVAGNQVVLGTAGEVATDTIQWGQNGGTYQLLLVPMN